MSSYSGGSGHDAWGNPLDTQPVAAEFRHLFPDLAGKPAPGGVQQEKRTWVYPGEGQGKKKRRPKKVKGPK